MPKLISLFSGCGGFSTGFEQAGFTTNLAIDIHPPSLETLRVNHKYANTILGDIRKKLKKNSRILLLGLSFKENVGDIRNSKSIELFKKIKNNSY